MEQIAPKGSGLEQQQTSIRSISVGQELGGITVCFWLTCAFSQDVNWGLSHLKAQLRPKDPCATWLIHPDDEWAPGADRKLTSHHPDLEPKDWLGVLTGSYPGLQPTGLLTRISG